MGATFGLLSALALWYFVFETGYLGGFWARITLASIALSIYARTIGGDKLPMVLAFNQFSIMKGVLSGCMLYIAFFLGFNLFNPILRGGALTVYVLGGESQRFFIIPTLFLTSFCEEYFWRRYFQATLMRRFGKIGLPIASLAYAFIHIWTMNPPLILAALIAGFYWGIIYESTGSFEVILWSHIAWTELIFVFLPLI